MEYSVTHLFSLGRLVKTPGADELIKEGLKTLPLVKRHVTGDWSDMTEEDQKANALAVAYSYRVFSAYETEHGKIWIITEADRSATTILLPSEYQEVQCLKNYGLTLKGLTKWIE